MKAIEIKEPLKPVWDAFVTQSPHSSLLQSWGWGEFQQEYGEEIIRLGVVSSQFSEGEEFLEAESKMIGAMLLIKRQLPRGASYFYSPHGPILSTDQTKEALTALLRKAEAEARKRSVAFLRLEPKINLNQELGSKPDPETIQARHTLILDISPPIKKILQQMKSKHRYNIRLAKRKGIKIVKAETVQEIDDFWRLLTQGQTDNNFQAHPKHYFQKQFEILSGLGMEDLLLAQKDGQTVAAILVGYFGRTAFYLHGAMARQHRRLMAPHYLQWQAILNAREKGCQEYNFWGVAPPDAKDNHPWQGFSRFKFGFAPNTKVTNYPGTYYIPYNTPAFWAFKALKKAKKWLDF
jgi:peptidoglycan pentaglycine glycine transferase (the first glycine)